MTHKEMVLSELSQFPRESLRLAKKYIELHNKSALRTAFADYLEGSLADLDCIRCLLCFDGHE